MQQHDMEAVRRKFLVFGRVQGVGFRAWTIRRATELQLRGTVRNRPDGAVEVEALGSGPAVARLRELLARGPASSQVRDVRELAAGADPLPAGFDVAW